APASGATKLPVSPVLQGFAGVRISLFPYFLSPYFLISRTDQSLFYKKMSSKGPVSAFLEKHYRHFNAATLTDAAKAYKKHVEDGKKMMITLAGAMSTAELGISLAEMIRQD